MDVMPVLDGRCWKGEVEKYGRTTYVELWQHPTDDNFYMFAAIMTPLRVMDYSKSAMRKDVILDALERLLRKDYLLNFSDFKWRSVDQEKLIYHDSVMGWEEVPS